MCNCATFDVDESSGVASAVVCHALVLYIVTLRYCNTIQIPHERHFPILRFYVMDWYNKLTELNESNSGEAISRIQ